MVGGNWRSGLSPPATRRGLRHHEKCWRRNRLSQGGAFERMARRPSYDESESTQGTPVGSEMLAGGLTLLDHRLISTTLPGSKMRCRRLRPQSANTVLLDHLALAV